MLLSRVNPTCDKCEGVKFSLESFSYLPSGYVEATVDSVMASSKTKADDGEGNVRVVTRCLSCGHSHVKVYRAGRHGLTVEHHTI